eukprot:6041344-Karenia_brevis.AAC.1
MKHRRPSQVQTYGFRPGRSPMLITELLRRLLFISHEWGPPVIIGSLDVATAFDSMDHSLVFHAMCRRGIPPHLAAALVDELRHVVAEAEIPGLTHSEPVAINR